MNLFSLPPELLTVCLSYLEGYHLAKVAQTCKLLQEIADLDILWQQRCQIEYSLESLDGWNGTYKEVYGKVLHKYGYLLGLWRNKTTCYGGLVHIWYKGDGCIVAEDYYAKRDVREALMSTPQFHITLTKEKDVQIGWLAGYMGPRPCTIQCEHSDRQKVVTVKWKEDSLANRVPSEREKALFLEACDVRGTHPELCMFKWQTHKEHDQKQIYVDITLPEPLPADKVPMQPGLFKGMYGGHGTEIILLTYDLYHNKANAMKISGDPNVPSGEISMSADLSRPMILTAEQQQSVSLLKNVNTEEDLPPNTEAVKLGKQAFVVPRDVGVEDHFTYPKFCIARYHSLGTVSPMGFKNPTKIANHFIVFDNDTFGLLWLDLYTFALFSRVHEQF